MTDELMEFRKSIDKLIKSYEHMRNENIQHEAGIKSLKKLIQVEFCEIFGIFIDGGNFGA